MRAFRNVYFTIGFIIAAGLLLASFLYSYWLKDIIPQPPKQIYWVGPSGESGALPFERMVRLDRSFLSGNDA
ncbi:hypothetical protein P9743_16655 [Anoxybacillus geothermalis]|nr:hypothetical protein [Anoxybacillus geothermalis]